MISALSQSQATAHAGQRVKQSETPAPQPVSTDDLNGLPPAPDGSSNNQTQTTTNNQQQPQQQQIIVIKEKPWWQKALPWAVAGLVALGGAVVGLRHLGNNFHETKVIPAMEKVTKEVEANNEYKTKFIDPRLEIHAKYEEYLKANPNVTEAEKKNLGEFLKNLLISEKGHVGDMYFIPVEGNKKALPIIFLQENLDVAQKALTEDNHLPKEFKDSIQGIFDTLLSNFSTYTDKYPQTSKNSDFSQKIAWSRDSSGNLSHELLEGKVGNISTGWQVATAKAKDWANKLIKRGKEEVDKNDKPKQDDPDQPRTIEIE